MEIAIARAKEMQAADSLGKGSLADVIYFAQEVRALAWGEQNTASTAEEKAESDRIVAATQAIVTQLEEEQAAARQAAMGIGEETKSEPEVDAAWEAEKKAQAAWEPYLTNWETRVEQAVDMMEDELNEEWWAMSDAERWRYGLPTTASLGRRYPGLYAARQAAMGIREETKSEPEVDSAWEAEKNQTDGMSDAERSEAGFSTSVSASMGRWDATSNVVTSPHWGGWEVVLDSSAAQLAAAATKEAVSVSIAAAAAAAGEPVARTPQPSYKCACTHHETPEDAGPIIANCDVCNKRWTKKCLAYYYGDYLDQSVCTCGFAVKRL